MSVALEATPIPVHWAEDPVRLGPRDECRRARLAWEKVAPADGLLPANPTPLQCMIYARMTTSIFIEAAARLRRGEKLTRLP
jgi:hypothetical protein